MRKLIYLCALLLLLFSGVAIIEVPEAVAWMHGGITGGGVPSNGTSCTQLITQPNANDNDYAFSTTAGQAIKSSSSIEVCKFIPTIRSEYGNTLTFKIQVWSDMAASVTQYGGDSDTQTIDSSVYGPITFTWDNTGGHEYPNPSGDYYIQFIYVSGTSGQLQFSTHNDYTQYEDTNYDFFDGGSDLDKDLKFEVWTMQ